MKDPIVVRQLCMICFEFREYETEKDEIVRYYADWDINYCQEPVQLPPEDCRRCEEEMDEEFFDEDDYLCHICGNNLEAGVDNPENGCWHCTYDEDDYDTWDDVIVYGE